MLKSRIVYHVQISILGEEIFSNAKNIFFPEKKIRSMLVEKGVKKTLVFEITGENIREAVASSIPVAKFISLVELGLEMVSSKKTERFAITKEGEDFFLSDGRNKLPYSKLFG